MSSEIKNWSRFGSKSPDSILKWLALVKCQTVACMASVESCLRLCTGTHNCGRKLVRSDNGPDASRGFGYLAQVVLFCPSNHRFA